LGGKLHPYDRSVALKHNIFSLKLSPQLAQRMDLLLPTSLTLEALKQAKKEERKKKKEEGLQQKFCLLSPKGNHMH